MDVDISSSRVARAISDKIISRSNFAVVDEGWVFEGVEEAELPERMLGGCRFIYTLSSRITSKLDVSWLSQQPQQTEHGGCGGGKEGSVQSEQQEKGCCSGGKECSSSK